MSVEWRLWHFIDDFLASLPDQSFDVFDCTEADHDAQFMITTDRHDRAGLFLPNAIRLVHLLIGRCENHRHDIRGMGMRAAPHSWHQGPPPCRGSADTRKHATL